MNVDIITIMLEITTPNRKEEITIEDIIFKIMKEKIFLFI